MSAEERPPPRAVTTSVSDAPPEAWPAAHRLLARVRHPVEKFLHVQAASGIVLVVAALIALVWANSPWAHSYEALWHASVGFHIGSLDLRAPLHFVINDGLMVIFFLLVGLEIRREMHGGELATIRRAALPFFAALGGMLVPAALYLALNRSGPARAGWGVPMATDIAFAVGVLALLGSRVPSGLRVLILALAIIDDIGAIVVIALFYSSGITIAGLGVAAAAVGSVILLQRLGARAPWAYIPSAIVLWAGLLSAGVHPTIGGVALGLLTPVRAWFGHKGFLERTEAAVATLRGEEDETALLGSLDAVAKARREAVSPLVKVETALHPWVAFGIMPVFALANAGVSLEGGASGAQSTTVTIGVLVGLAVGKPLGVMLGCRAAIAFGVASLPRRVTYRGLFVVGLVSGIGFTMAIFIANLAFSGTDLLGAAKIGVLLASAVAAAGALVVGRLVLRPPDPATPDISAHDAEISTDE